MKTTQMMMAAITAAAWALCVAISPNAAAGSLTPPGPAGASMKTMQEVYDKADEAETRIAINGLPATIDAPGTYYLTHSQSYSGVDAAGITVRANDVTIDLNGATLTGPGKIAGSWGIGILAVENTRNTTIRNGTIREWRSQALGIRGNGGVVENLYCQDNGSGYAIQLAGEDGIVRNNVCADNIGGGISLYCGKLCEGNVCIQGQNGIQSVGGYCVVCNNTCFSAAERGIAGDVGDVIKNNEVADAGQYAIWANTSSLIEGNVCSRGGGGGAGLHLREWFPEHRDCSQGQHCCWRKHWHPAFRPGRDTVREYHSRPGHSHPGA